LLNKAIMKGNIVLPTARSAAANSMFKSKVAHREIANPCVGPEPLHHEAGAEISDNRHGDRHQVREQNALMENVVDALGLARSVSAGNEGDRSNHQPEHRHHQQEYELTREPKRRQRFLGVGQTTAHGSVYGQGDDAEHVQADDRHRQIEEAPEDGAIDAFEWT
jgi:hypothetical protein